MVTATEDITKVYLDPIANQLERMVTATMGGYNSEWFWITTQLERTVTATQR